MEIQELILRLRREIDIRLGDIVGKRVIIPDAPYYGNIGDLMIWQGTEDWLRNSGRKILSQSGTNTFLFPEVDEDVTIILMGGGNFGDLWRIHQEDRLRIIKKYPSNRIVMLPQSVWYDDKSLIKKDARIFAAHRDIHLCARDHHSYEFLKSNFGVNNIYLVPDLSFAINESRLIKYRGKGKNRRLYLRREDKELSISSPLSIPGSDVIADWPSLERDYSRFEYFRKSYSLSHKLRYAPRLRSILNKVIDIASQKFLRDSLVKEGCRFLTSYSEIVTTRLHAMLLAAMLHKNIRYLDNSTGKLSSFVETWMKDVKNIKAYEGGY